MESIISLDQFDKASIKNIFSLTSSIKKQDNLTLLDILRGKIVTLLFYEPSSRTFSSFAVAAKRLGAQTIEYQNPLGTSSAVKGETLEDTIKVFEAYSDLIVIRHPEIGSAKRAVEATKNIPVINAGDGAGEHPTQTLLDLYTIYEKFGKIDGLKIVLAGDLLYGRTIHSLMKALALYNNISVYLLAPDKLKLPEDDVKKYTKKGLRILELQSEKDIPKDCQVWYWTRVQKERFKEIKDYEAVKNKFILTENLLKTKGNDDMVVMHPLPRVGEIETAIDSDKRAIYLTNQVKNGMYVRMALLKLCMEN